MNATKLKKAKPEDLKIVMQGCGAAGVAVTQLLQHAGYKNFIVCDTKGAIYKGRTENMNKFKEIIAESTNPNCVKGKISEVIEIVKKNCKGYGVIDEEKTRDKVLYGSVDKECTGIVTTIYASPEVIKKAAEFGANFIICHEACFWNHGDHTDWLVRNKTFLQKKALLEEYGITDFYRKSYRPVKDYIERHK
mgnify:CR=1 FL=1